MPVPRFPFAPTAIAVALALPVAATADDHRSRHHGAQKVSLEVAATYRTFTFDEGASEIVAYDPATERLFVTNGDEKRIDVLDASVVDPDAEIEDMPLLFSKELSDDWKDAKGANSVATKNGYVAAAVENDDGTQPGRVMLFDTDMNFLCDAEVGVLPDMVTFTPDGNTILSANEGEPDGGVDPEGSVSMVDLDCNVNTLGFAKFNEDIRKLRRKGVRLFPDVGSSITVAQDLEPEYIAVSPDGRTAWVTLQEANAVAIVDLKREEIVEIRALGLKKHFLPGNGLDPSDRDDGINIRPWPVFGMYMPDAIASYRVKGKTYYVTANEGDDRGDADDAKESPRGDAVRLKDIGDVETFDRDGLMPSGLVARLIEKVDLDDSEKLGRLNISSIDGIDRKGRLHRLQSYGTRSFSIWGPHGLVYDSGSDFERIIAQLAPDYFNYTNDDNNSDSFEDRSDNKGPEPEAIAIGEINGHTYAFIGLERIGGIMVYDVTNPYKPVHQYYLNYRDFSVDAKAGTEAGTVGDLGPEGIAFIAAGDSPEKGTPMIAVANEISGTTTLYRVLVERKTGGPHGHDGWRPGRHDVD